MLSSTLPPMDIDEAFESLDITKRINIASYTKVRQLGKGRFVEVVEVRSPVGQRLALKKWSSLCHLNDVVGAISEIRALLQMDHPNILKCLGYDYKEIKYEEHSSFNFYIIMELADASLPLSIKENDNNFQIEVIKQFSFQLLSACLHLSKNNISHRDIKPENILIFQDHLKLNIGFGNIIQTHFKHSPLLAGTINYMSPELIGMILSNSGDCKVNYFRSDVFSLGLVFLRLSTSENTEGINNQNHFSNLEEKIDSLIFNVLKKYKNESLGSLLKNMLVIDKNKRMDFIQLWEFATQKGQFFENDVTNNLLNLGNTESQLESKIKTIEKDSLNTSIIKNW